MCVQWRGWSCWNTAISGSWRKMKQLLFTGLILCALSQAQEIRSGMFRGRPVHFKTIDGVPVTEGDIILDAENSSKTSGKEAIGRFGDRYRWPEGVVPYE